MFAPATVLRAKLRPPAGGVQLLDRPRLHRLLDDATAAPLTLLVAPAGTGKTSLLSSWAATSGRTVAWLSLDETDRDVAQLWTGVAAALGGDGLGAEAVLEAVDALLDELQEQPREPAVLVIDDAHLVDGAPLVAESLTLFVSHLPGWLRVVIASRTTPDLPLSRLRARGQLREVEYADLRFTSGESIGLLQSLAPTLPTSRLDQLARRSQGWAASLQLTALAARRGSQVEVDPDGAELLNEYLWDEVLAAEDPDVLDVLLATSVAERIDADLARHVAGRDDAPALLETARSRGLLVTRVEAETYRVHDLMRAELLREAERRRPGRTRELHAVAATWCEEQGDVVRAIEHWLAAGRTRDALRLLAASSGPLYDAGRDETIRRVIARLPLAVAVDDADAMVELTWCHLLVDRHRFRELSDELGRIEEPPQHLVPRILLLRAMTALSRGEWASGARLAREALDHWGARWWADPLGRFAWNMVGREVALTERWDDGDAEARQVVQALTLDPDRRLAFEPSRAVGHALAGRPGEVVRISAEVRAVLDLHLHPFQRAELEIAEALARREAGERAHATRDLLEIVSGQPGLISFSHLLGWLVLAETRMEEGDLDRAEVMFGEAAALVAGELPGPGTRSLLARTGVVLALAAGRTDEAAGWAGQVDDGFWGPVSLFRATGDPAHLASAVPRCPRHEVVLGLQRFRATGDADHVQAALDVAVPLGMVQTIASEGPTVTAAVEAIGWQLPRPWLVALRAAASRPNDGVGLESAEPLTDRERDVLRFLPTTMTIREIADQLFISQNTVKSHVKSIYRKLGCSTRAEAADRLRTATHSGRAPEPLTRVN